MLLALIAMYLEEGLLARLFGGTLVRAVVWLHLGDMAAAVCAAR